MKKYLISILLILFLFIGVNTYAYTVGSPSAKLPPAYEAYAPESGAADQGVTDTGSITIKNLVDEIGASKRATIIVAHTGASDETTYTLNTNETITSNIGLWIEEGAIIDGAGTLTINGPFEHGLSQCFGSSITVVFGSGSIKEDYPEWWGENTTPGTTDMMTEVNSALDAFSVIKLQGETYLVNYLKVDKSNRRITGSGWNTIIETTGTGGGLVDAILTINYLNNNTPIKNTTIKNLTLKGKPAVFFTSIAMGHVENVIIDNVFFNGFGTADGVMVGGQLYGGGPAEPVAKNITIKNCYFDGLNYTSRNAISLITVDGALVDNNYFTRTTSVGNPGAIDIEPDLATDYARGITISNNRFYSIGALGARKPPLRIDFSNMDVTYPERKGRIAFKDNTVIIASGIMISGAAAAFTEPVPIEISGNTFRDVTGSWTMTSVNGLIIGNNTFLSGGLLHIGTAGFLSRRVKILNNVFDTCPVDLGSPISLFLSDDVEITGNSFIDCGVDAGVGNVAIYMAGANIGTDIHDNDFSTPNTITATSVYNNAGTQDGNSTFLNNILEDGIALPIGWVGGYGCNEIGLLNITNVAFNADADTIIYTVPTGKRCVLTKAIIIAGADAGATTTISIGANGSETDFVPNNTLSNLDAQYDSVIVKPIPNTTPLKNKSYAATTVIDARIANQSGGATNTVYLFGILY